MYTYINKNGGRKQKQGKATANQQPQGQGKAPTLKQKGYHPRYSVSFPARFCFLPKFLI